MANELKISIENDEVLTGSRLNCIDFNNLLVKKSCGPNETFSYTFTEDCWGLINGIPDHAAITVDNVAFLSYANANDKTIYNSMYPFKKGQVYFSGRDAYQSQYLTCFGIKR